MQEQFKQWLIRKGYKEYTPSGHPSTAYDYVKRVDKVCKIENCSWDTLAKNINSIVPLYDCGGEKADIGKQSHSAVISALKQFHEFVRLCRH